MARASALIIVIRAPNEGSPTSDVGSVSISFSLSRYLSLSVYPSLLLADYLSGFKLGQGLTARRRRCCP